MPIDQLLPRWHFQERHRRATTAPAGAVLVAVEQLTWAEVPIFRALMILRSAGRIRPAGSDRILGRMAELGFTVVERRRDEVIIAALGRPWAPGGRRAPRMAAQADPAAFFAGFAEPGWAKMIVNFRVEDGAVTTETRVWLTDERSRRAFARYWLLIRPFSGLIRRRWLAAAVRRSTRA
jgi:hypothetical protein